jgi:hypothetical protein
MIAKGVNKSFSSALNKMGQFQYQWQTQCLPPVRRWADSKSWCQESLYPQTESSKGIPLGAKQIPNHFHHSMSIPNAG